MALLLIISKVLSKSTVREYKNLILLILVRMAMLDLGSLMLASLRPFDGLTSSDSDYYIL